MSSINFTSPSSGGSQNLQQVTDIGNTTTNQIAGTGLKMAATIITSEPYFATITDFGLHVDCTAFFGDIRIVLPVGNPIGKIFFIKMIAPIGPGQQVIISVDAGGSIEGAVTYNLSIDNQAIVVQQTQNKVYQVAASHL